MPTRRSILAGLMSLGAVALMPAASLAATWVNLGSRTVSLLVDHDTIFVGVGSGLYTDVRLKVTGNTVFISSMKITFGNGTTENVSLRFMFFPGSASRVISLPGPARFIRKVDLVYSKLIGGGTAVVTLQGRRV